MRRRTCIFFLVSLLPCLLVSTTVVAQPSGGYDEVNDCLRFLPTRVTNHVRSVREYKLPTDATGQRELIQTTHFNRQGHLTYSRHRSEIPDSTEYTYDSLNRLVQWQRVERRWDNDSQRMVWNHLFVENIEYTPEGVVGLCRLVSCERDGSAIDTSVCTYRLVSLVRNANHHVTQCDYAYYEREASHGMVEEQTDTCCFRREYDDKGRLVRQIYTDEVGSRGLEGYDERYVYDAQGRVRYRINSYGGYDSLAYRYNPQGGIMEMSGRLLAQGIETDIHVSYRLDGSPKERTEISRPSHPEEWDNGATSKEQTTTRTLYDAKGSIIRTEHPNYTLELDVVYWG